jgi:hypothetical protein
MGKVKEKHKRTRKAMPAPLTVREIKMNDLAWERLAFVVTSWGHPASSRGIGEYLEGILTPPSKLKSLP